MSEEILKEENQEEQILEGDIDERFNDLAYEQEILRWQSEIEIPQKDMMSFAEFKKGTKDAGYYAGFYNTLVSSGFSNAQAVDLVINQMNILHNQEMCKIDLEKCKYQMQSNQVNTMV